MNASKKNDSKDNHASAVDSEEARQRRRKRSWFESLHLVSNLNDQRKDYERLRRMYLLENTSKIDYDDDGDEQSPITIMRRHDFESIYRTKDIARVVSMDTRRLMLGEGSPASRGFWRRREVQSVLVRAMTVYLLKSNEEYKQGLHELIAVMFCVMRRASVGIDGEGVDEDDEEEEEEEEVDDLDVSVCEGETNDDLFDVRFIEHDCFMTFNAFVQNKHLRVLEYYRNNNSPEFIDEYCERFKRAMYFADEECFHSFDIEPRMFLPRYLKLCYVREFSYDDVLQLWDAFIVSGFNEGSVTNNKEEKTKDFFEAVAVASVLTCRTDIIDAARKNSKDANFDKFGTILKRVNKLPPGIDIKAIIDRARDIASRRSRAKHGYDSKSMIKNSNDSLLEEEEKEEGDFDESPFKGSIFAAMLEIREDYVLE